MAGVARGALGSLRNRIYRARIADATLPPPFYVVSHERSGTHFMINTLRENAALRPEVQSAVAWNGPYVSGAKNQFAHIDALAARWDEILAGTAIIQTHSDRELFDFRYPKAKVVYVLRDPRDTLVSFYYYFTHPIHTNVLWSAEHQYASVSEFLRRPLTTYLRWSNSLHGRANSVAERLALHVKGWLGAPDTVIVRYEELKTDYRGVLERLTPFLGLPILPHVAPVGLHDRPSFAPRKGEIGDWRNHLTPEDEALVRAAVERAGLDWEAVTWRD